MNQDTLNYEELSGALLKFQPTLQVSQIHGLMCGFICATSGEDSDFWAICFPRVKKNKKIATLFQALYENSYRELSEYSFEFSLLLPQDEVEINKRAEALGLWCQGFLTALEASPILIEGKAPAEVIEAIDDMIEIAKINFGDIVQNEEDETAYFELVEYVRLNALMIFQDLKLSKKNPYVVEGEEKE